jgi:TolA-binding protein
MMATNLRIAAVTLAVAVSGLIGQAALADSVQIERMPTYTDVRITNVKGGKVTFGAPSGPVTKNVSELVTFQITGQPVLNQAEALLHSGKAAEAVKVFDTIARNGDQPWIERLVRYRLIKALDEAGLPQRAVKEWLAAAEEDGAAAVALRPRKTAEKGSKDNDEAITLLEARRAGVKDAAVADAIKAILVDFYTKQGKDKAAAAMTAAQGGANAAEAPAAEAVDDSTGFSSSASPSLKALEAQIQQGQADKVAKEVQGALGRYTRAELPGALCLLGKARLAMAEKAKGADREKLLAQAGLSFMRVWVYFPESREAAESLMGAGTANERLGNPGAARAAYEDVVSRFSKDAAHRAVVEQAKAAIEAIKKGPAATTQAAVSEPKASVGKARQAGSDDAVN